ncbi:MAG TPA: response regulator [Terriglobales bacterium]|nr:response regulator [Terriglobales bacterium]
MLATRTNTENATILVVDDSPDMRRYLRCLLELENYHVETANNGLEALRRLEGGCAPALVLLDLQMPGLDGLGALRHMRKQYPHLKVIICSAEDDPEMLYMAAQLGAHAHLSKPVHHLYLSAAVERCLASERQEISHGASVITLPPPAEGNWGAD